MDYDNKINNILKNEEIWGENRYFSQIKTISSGSFNLLKDKLNETDETDETNQINLSRLLKITKSMKSEKSEATSFFIGILASVVAISTLSININQTFNSELFTIAMILIIIFLIAFIGGKKEQDKNNLKLECIIIAIEELIG